MTRNSNFTLVLFILVFLHFIALHFCRFEQTLLGRLFTYLVNFFMFYKIISRTDDCERTTVWCG